MSRAAIFVLGAGAAAAWAAVDEPPTLPALIAPRVATGPEIDGDATEPAWHGAGRLDVPTTGGPTVHIRALVADDALCLLAVWADPRPTLAKQQWVYDGNQWRQGLGRSERHEAGRALTTQVDGVLGAPPQAREAARAESVRNVVLHYAAEDEDRFAVLWPTGDAVAAFRESGCAYFCHTEDPDAALHDMWATSAHEGADLWHWKSARTNPEGWADDQHLAFRETAQRGGGRQGDPDESPGYRRNATRNGTGPAFGFSPESDTASRTFLRARDAVEVEQGFAPPAGTTLPGYVLARPTGNRGDIVARGRWADGQWTLEMRRPLRTGHAEHDVQLLFGRSYPLGIAVMDNGGGAVHTTSVPFELRLTDPLRPPRVLPGVLTALGGLVVLGLVGMTRRGHR